MKTSTETLIAAMHILATEIQSDDGVANSAIAEAGERLAEQHMRIKRLEGDSQRLNWLLNRGLAWRDCYNDWWKEGEWLYASQSALETIDKAKEAKLNNEHLKLREEYISEIERENERLNEQNKRQNEAIDSLRIMYAKEAKP